MLEWVATTEGRSPSDDWHIAEQVVRVGSHRLRCTYADNADGSLHLKKPPGLIEAYATFLEDFRGANLVELGISEGGGLALAHLLARPRRLVGVELEPRRVPELDRFIEQRRSDDPDAPMSAHYGVDQADRARLGQILDDEFGDEQIDLVIDDASHLLDPTRASFETLFPRIRPGGAYVIEDWNWQHLMADGYRAAYTDPENPYQQQFASFLSEAIEDPDHPWHEHAMEQVGRHLAASSGSGSDSGSDSDSGSAPAAPPDDASTAHPDRPLSDLVIQLLLARASTRDTIATVTATELWVVVERGHEPLDHDGFRLSDLYEDIYGQVR